MRNAMVCIAALLCLAPLAPGASLDGRWSAEFQPGKTKGATAKNAAGATTLNLSIDGNHIGGSVRSGKRTMTIQDGKLDGSSFSFVTVRKGKKGEARMLWSGMLEGDTIHGTRSREGAKRRASFTAKRIS